MKTKETNINPQNIINAYYRDYIAIVFKKV